MMSNIGVVVRVAIDSPAGAAFDYICSMPVSVGQLVHVPFGRDERVGVVIAIPTVEDKESRVLKSVFNVLNSIIPFNDHWLALCHFAARYYLRSVGEVILPALPAPLREADRWVNINRILKKIEHEKNKNFLQQEQHSVLNPEQQRVYDTIIKEKNKAIFSPIVLFGITGSGKTEVYLNVIAQIQKNNSLAQILLLIPEINLTPQFEQRLHHRFPHQTIALLHSRLAEGARTRHWLAAHTGQAQIILGTRLAVMASLPNLALIIVDEEHDASFRQQERLRYSARDLAVWRAHALSIPVILGSATPSLESWYRVQQGIYQRLDLLNRAVEGAKLPAIHLIDLNIERQHRRTVRHGLSVPLLKALEKRLASGEQSLLFLNRRGYAPVLECDACAWVSVCPRCSVNQVLHRLAGSDTSPEPRSQLICHHCAYVLPVPTHCPDCGSDKIQPVGLGTQKLEEALNTHFPQARILRLDADTTRLKGALEAALDAIHQGNVDIVIGTQMVAKGHDFKNMTLVGIINPDTALMSQDFRASERLFAQLMQVSGRAGRAEKSGLVLIQTRYPHEKVYQSLIRHDFIGHAQSLLEEREETGLPPFAYQALLTAEAKSLDWALAFLHTARTLGEGCLGGDVMAKGLMIYDPIPHVMMRLDRKERAQILVESMVRPVLQAFLEEWLPLLAQIRPQRRWTIERDPMVI